jgi:hypothetical protein
VQVADWPEEWRMNLEERAGIMQFGGGLPRDESERQAEARVRLEYARPLAAPSGSPPETVFAEAAPLSQGRGSGEARAGRSERKPGDPDGEWASSGS